jgi:hypothetical protein
MARSCATRSARSSAESGWAGELTQSDTLNSAGSCASRSLAYPPPSRSQSACRTVIAVLSASHGSRKPARSRTFSNQTVRWRSRVQPEAEAHGAEREHTGDTLTECPTPTAWKLTR